MDEKKKKKNTHKCGIVPSKRDGTKTTKEKKVSCLRNLKICFFRSFCVKIKQTL